MNSKENITADFETPINSEIAKNNFAYVYLFYNTLSYTLSIENPTMDIVALLANIGGTIGLFLGVSLLHVSELVEALIELIYIKRSKQDHAS